MIRERIILVRRRVWSQLCQIINIIKVVVAKNTPTTSAHMMSVVAEFASTECFNGKATVAEFATVQIKYCKA